MWAGSYPGPGVLCQLHEFVVGSKRCSEDFSWCASVRSRIRRPQGLPVARLLSATLRDLVKSKKSKVDLPAFEGAYLEYIFTVNYENAIEVRK